MKRLLTLLFFFISQITSLAQSNEEFLFQFDSAVIDMQQLIQMYLPTTSNECHEIIDYDFYSVSFCEKYHLSEWAIYVLSPELLSDSIKRTSNFTPDPNLKKRGIGTTLKDYYKSGFDRGHLVPAADMKYNRTSMSESFYLTNIVPQSPSFNRGANRIYENDFRQWGDKITSNINPFIIVIVGWNTNDNFTEFIHSSFDDDSVKKIPIPENYYRIFIDPVELRSIAFYLPTGKYSNRKKPKDLISYAISIDSLETITGLDFFHKFSDAEEMLLELDTGKKKSN